MNGKRYNRRPRRTTKAKRAYKKRSTGSTAVAKLVKREIHRNIENKTIQYSSQNNFIGPYVNSSNGLHGFPLTPYSSNLAIVQGTGQGNRIGNTIRTRKLVLSYVLWANAYDATYNTIPVPQEVKIWIGYYKPTPMTQPVNANFAVFFQQGDTSTAPSSTLQDILSNVNSDNWLIKKTLTHKVGFGNNQGTGGSAANQYLANNDFKLNVVRKIDLTKYASKVFKFNDNTSNNPTTGSGLYMMITSVGAINNTPEVRPIKLSYWLDYQFEDA